MDKTFIAGRYVAEENAIYMTESVPDGVIAKSIRWKYVCDEGCWYNLDEQ